MEKDQLGYYYRQIEIAFSKYNKILYELDQLNFRILNTNNLINGWVNNIESQQNIAQLYHIDITKYDEMINYKNILIDKVIQLQNRINFMSINAYNFIMNNHEWNMWTSKTII
jgi:hypothetical protein